jgi:hypothetical protein
MHLTTFWKITISVITGILLVSITMGGYVLIESQSLSQARDAAILIPILFMPLTLIISSIVYFLIDLGMHLGTQPAHLDPVKKRKVRRFHIALVILASVANAYLLVILASMAGLADGPKEPCVPCMAFLTPSAAIIIFSIFAYTRRIAGYLIYTLIGIATYAMIPFGLYVLTPTIISPQLGFSILLYAHVFILMFSMAVFLFAVIEEAKKLHQEDIRHKI